MKPNEPTVKLHTSIPIELKLRLDAVLAPKGIPSRGAYQQFISDRIREYLEWQSLDLGPMGLSGTVCGPTDTLTTLYKHLKATQTLQTLYLQRKDET
jgi:hypothetical protein